MIRRAVLLGVAGTVGVIGITTAVVLWTSARPVAVTSTAQTPLDRLPMEITGWLTTDVDASTTQFSVTVSNASATSLVYRWHYVDLSTQQSALGCDWNWSNKCTITAPHPGDYKISVEVKSPDGGTVTSEKTWTFADPPVPTVQFTGWTVTPVTSLITQFGVDTANAPDGTQFQWQYYDNSTGQWSMLADWRDAHWESSSWVTFTAPHAGDYTIKVTTKTPAGATEEATHPWSSTDANLTSFGATTCTSPGPGPDLGKANKIISATVNLNGSGTGFQGKVLLSDGLSAVSFGLQYDTHAYGGKAFSGKAAFLSENVSTSNNSYVYKDWCIGALSTDTTVMLAYFAADQTAAFYVAGVYIGSQPTFYNGSGIYAVEGDVKHNGDTLDTTISSILTGTWGGFGPGSIKDTTAPPHLGVNKTDDSTLQNLKIHFSGTAAAFSADQDWDSNPGAAAAIAIV